MQDRIEKVDPETKHLLLKYVTEEVHHLIKQHKKEIGFSNLDKTVESIVFLALVDYPKEVEKLENRIKKLESEIEQMHRQQ